MAFSTYQTREFFGAATEGTIVLKQSRYAARSGAFEEVTVVKALKTQLVLSDGARINRTGAIVGERYPSFEYRPGTDKEKLVELQKERAAEREFGEARRKLHALLDSATPCGPKGAELYADMVAMIAKWESKPA